MDKNQQKALKEIIRQEIGDMVSKEIEIRLKPIEKAVQLILESNDKIAEQIRDDRKDINQIKIDQAKSTKATGVIIDNQNNQEETLSNVVSEAAKDIPKATEKAVEKMFEKKSFLKRLRDKFGR